MISAFLGKDTVDTKEAREIFSQIHNPQHCYIKTSAGLFCHKKKDDVNPMAGKPIRFTRVAAERYVKYLKSCHIKAEIV